MIMAYKIGEWAKAKYEEEGLSMKDVILKYYRDEGDKLINKLI